MDTAMEEAAIDVTDVAIAKARRIVEEQGHPELMLRVYVEGGGCSGFQYGFDLDEQVEDGDMLIARDGVRFVVDPMSYQYLMGSEIDYKEDLQGAQFVVINPNAKTTCGCGMSFSI